MNTNLRNADLAILGLLMEQPRHGYQIEQVIQERDMRDWTEIGFSSIYAILARLENRRLLRAALEPSRGRGPARKVYRITRSGRAAWKRATLQALSAPREGGLPLLLGLVGLPAIPAQEAIAALQEYRDRLIERHDRVAARKNSAGPNLPMILEGIFDYGLALAEAEIEWVGDFLRQLEHAAGSAARP